MIVDGPPIKDDEGGTSAPAPPSRLVTRLSDPIDARHISARVDARSVATGPNAQLNLAVFLILFAMIGVFISKTSLSERKVDAVLGSLVDEPLERSALNGLFAGMGSSVVAQPVPRPDDARSDIAARPDAGVFSVARPAPSAVHDAAFPLSSHLSGDDHQGLIIKHDSLFDENGVVSRAKMIALQRLVQYLGSMEQRSSESGLSFRMLILAPNPGERELEDHRSYFARILKTLTRFGLSPEQAQFGYHLPDRSAWWMVVRPVVQ